MRERDSSDASSLTTFFRAVSKGEEDCGSLFRSSSARQLCLPSGRVIQGSSPQEPTPHQKGQDTRTEKLEATDFGA